MILKDRLTFFPSPGEGFALRDGGETRRATIDAVDCECRGPDRPHQHYRLGRAGLQAGDRVRISREGCAGTYELQVIAASGLRRNGPG